VITTLGSVEGYHQNQSRLETIKHQGHVHETR